MAQITFKYSLEKYKMVYYHFLDNFINSKTGDQLINVIDFIKKEVYIKCIKNICKYN